MKHPPIKGRTVDQWDIYGQGGIARCAGWRFDEEPELVSRTWTLEILEGDSVVSETRFRIRVKTDR